MGFFLLYVQLQDQNTTIVLNVLAGLKDKDFDAAVNSLDADQLDVLMKYPSFPPPTFYHSD